MQKDIKTIRLNVEGMHCTNCALGVRKSLEREGFSNVFADFASNEVKIDVEDQSKISLAVKTIQSLGYKVSLDSENDPAEKAGLSSIEKKFWFSAIFTVPLIAAMFVPVEFLHNDIFQLALTIPVFAVGFWHFGRSAFMSLRSGVANMDVLIFLGSTAAFVYSLVGTILGLGHNYMFYETSASIISIVLLGNMLEQRSVKKTTSAIDDLVKLQDNTARLITMDMHEGQEQISEIHAGKLVSGNRVLVASGDKIPADGEIYWGHCSVDESMVSGESIPVEKKPGDQIVGGTLLVSGSIKAKITAAGNDTVLAGIIDMVRNAQKDKPGLQNLADRISMVFVPVVVGLSIATFLFWYFGFDLAFRDALMRSIAVMVIACPCALGLAIPTAVVVGLGRTAKSGILLRGGSSFDRLSQVDTVVFDKTGTLTTGDFSIRETMINGIDEQTLAAVVHSLEKHSSHPIARALTRHFDRKVSLELKSVEELKGLGMIAEDEKGNRYAIGSYAVAAHLTSDQTHHVYVVMNDELVAWFDLEDDIKPEAKKAIDRLLEKGIRPVMLSGDREKRCREVADKLGIKEVYAEKLPSQKLEIIDQLALNSRIAMIGDGINDAPALAKAHIGISMSDATQIAVKSAEVVLLKGNLELLTKAFASARTTQRTIKENLFWAFFYNVAAIPLAMVGLLTPIVAAGAMALSDVVVVFNSLRLKRRRLR